MRVKLTKTVVEKAVPGTRPVLVHDTELRGFHLKVLPTGTRAYFYYYRTADGTERRPKIGDHGEITCEQARGIAQAWAAEVCAGRDPGGHRAAGRAAPIVRELMERYFKEHVEPRNKASTAKETRRLIDKKINPALGSIKVAALTRGEIRSFQNSMRETPFEANQALARLSKAFTLATAEWGLRPDNPCARLQRYRVEKRERFYSEAELSRIGKVLIKAAADESESRAVILAIWLLALTGCRLGEVLGMRWSDLDLSQGLLRLPETKTGAKTVVLPAAVTALLSGTDRASDWIVSGSEKDRPLSRNVMEKAWARLRIRAGVSDGRLHDFRHTVGTYGAQTGANAFMIRDLLRQKDIAVTAGYVQRATVPMRALADRVANRVGAALSGIEPAPVKKLAEG